MSSQPASTIPCEACGHTADDHASGMCLARTSRIRSCVCMSYRPQEATSATLTASQPEPALTVPKRSPESHMAPQGTRERTMPRWEDDGGSVMLSADWPRWRVYYLRNFHRWAAVPPTESAAEPHTSPTHTEALAYAIREAGQ